MFRRSSPASRKIRRIGDLRRDDARRHGLLVLHTRRRAGVTIPMVLMPAEPLTQGVVGASVTRTPVELDLILAQAAIRLRAVTRR